MRLLNTRLIVELLGHHLAIIDYVKRNWATHLADVQQEAIAVLPGDQVAAELPQLVWVEVSSHRSWYGSWLRDLRWHLGGDVPSVAVFRLCLRRLHVTA